MPCFARQPCLRSEVKCYSHQFLMPIITYCNGDLTLAFSLLQIMVIYAEVMQYGAVLILKLVDSSSTNPIRQAV